MLGRLHAWLLWWLWARAITLAAFVALAWLLGSWTTAWHVLAALMCSITVVILGELFVAGWRESRRRAE